MLDEFRPMLCPFSTEIARAIEYLELFLPLNVKPEEADVGYKLWMEEFMQLWDVCHNACLWENVRDSYVFYLDMSQLNLTY